MVIGKIAEDPALAGLAERLKQRGGVVGATGLWGSSAPMAAAALHETLRRPLLYVSSHLEEADDTLDDLEFFLGRRCSLLPAWETLPGEGAASGEIEAERLRLCLELNRLHEARVKPKPASVSPARSPRESVKVETVEPLTIVAPIQALLQPVPKAEVLAAGTRRLFVGQTEDVDTLIAWLTDRGFTRLDRVETPGDFARRGDIVDIFAPGESDPYRIEFLDERIESIRRFDVSSQRSLATLPEIALAALTTGRARDSIDLTDFFDYLPKETLIVLDNPAEIQELGNIFYERLGRPNRVYDVAAIFRKANRFDQLHIARVGGLPLPAGDCTHFQVSSLVRFDGALSEPVAELCDAARNHEVHVVCENASQVQRLTELVRERAGESPDSLKMPLGMVHRGFEWTPARLMVIGHHQLFGRMLQRRRMRRTHASRPLESWLDLAPGDFVVHATHGIARFREIKTISKDVSGKLEEFLTLEFADQAVLHVPTSQIDLVQKYIGAGGIKPTLSKLGGTRWKTTKERVREAVTDLAESLVRIQAARQEKGGTSYPADTEWQKEFEGSFVYDETEDQLQANDEIKKDLARSVAMDRLLCGDVGFGKTELSMRAAFKVIEYGRQVAVLVPTTVLAEQHNRTFRERFAEYPFSIGCLSRFRTLKEQKKLVEQAKKGQIDLLIGTHRLLSKDVGFANLGLIVIDEEQRFGVEHKEKLKELRETVEVLTMTATPIPRTLHMSMLGIRDISSLATPPVDRRSIATQIRTFEPELIRSAILREMNRDGQVFFLHNFVLSIEAMAAEIRRIVPEARIVFGHGQMAEGELAKVMRTFVRHEADVLVATTIIESGIDIPNANTIFINRADRFGLADLHQLRGRVGRSHHRAYCYLLLSADRPVTDKAARRLKAVEEFSELGAGFRIAMRDLEIRGAGNILGPEQSGHIASVGYEMYCQLLERAVRGIRGEPEKTPPPVHLELDVVAHIPKTYVPSAPARIDVYRRMVSCQTTEELAQLQKDLTDIYGKYPPPVDRLLELAELRILARKWRIHSIVAQPPDLVIRTQDLALAQKAFANAPGSVRMPDPTTIHLRLPPAYLEPATLLPVLRKILRKNE